MIVSSNENETDAGLGVMTLEDEPQLKEPPLFQVVLLNDDFTPMEFVVYAIQKVFGYEHEIQHAVELFENQALAEVICLHQIF